jgi:hypothetical protein
MKNCFLLNEILTILDHEKVLIRTLFWNTTRPNDVTPSCMSLFVVSYNTFTTFCLTAASIIPLYQYSKSVKDNFCPAIY